MTPEEAEALVDAYARVQAVHFLGDVQLYLADALVPVWQATEWRAGAPQPPPFWAFAWPGSLALARYLIDNPALVAAKAVLDFGSGSGLAAIVAARLGASPVAAADIDPLAAAAQRLNAALNAVTIESVVDDLIGCAVTAEVILAGDVCYDRADTERTLPWLRELAGGGTLVLLADPGRHYAPSAGIELLATYDIPTLHELESQPEKRTRLWRLLP